MSRESTTPDLVERWRQMEEAFLRRDFDAGMSFFAPDAVWDASSAGIDRSEGATAIRSFLEEWLGAYEEYEYSRRRARTSATECCSSWLAWAVASLIARPGCRNDGATRSLGLRG